MKKKVVSLLMAGALVCSMGMTASAQVADNPLTGGRSQYGEGFVADRDGGDEDLIDVAFSAQGFRWVVSEQTRATDGQSYDIWSGDYKIINQHERSNLKVTLAYDVSDATGAVDEVSAISSDIELKLTGDLAHTGAEDLLNSTGPVQVEYDDVLHALEEWEYGFGGSYNSAVLPQTSARTDYMLTLGLEVVSFD